MVVGPESVLVAARVVGTIVVMLTSDSKGFESCSLLLEASVISVCIVLGSPMETSDGMCNE